jgi:hypothetical protein
MCEEAIAAKSAATALAQVFAIAHELFPKKKS